MDLTKEQVVAILPHVAHLDEYFPFLFGGMKKFDINTSSRMGAYIAQIGHESDSFRAMREYASGEAYENRTDLGNIRAGDGVRFAGRGPLQATGRDMYHSVSMSLFDDLRLMAQPELLEQPAFGFLSSAWIWAVSKGLNAVADEAETWICPGPHQYTKFQYITVRINGGLNGYADRLANYQRARSILKF